MLLASLRAANSAWVLLLSPEQKIIFDKRQHLALKPNTNTTNTNYFLSIGRRRNQTSMTCFLPHPAGISFHGLAHISGPEQLGQMFFFSCLEDYLLLKTMVNTKNCTCCTCLPFIIQLKSAPRWGPPLTCFDATPTAPDFSPPCLPTVISAE